MNNTNTKKRESTPAKKPNEVGGITFSSSIKITDPNTKEVILHTRGDK